MPKLRATFARLSSVNTKFVIRGLLLALPVAVLATAAALGLKIYTVGVGSAVSAFMSTPDAREV